MLQARSFDGSRKLIVIGLLVIAILVLITFQPALRGGFYGDDWWQVGRTAWLSPLEDLTSYFNPTMQKTWYRPLHGVLLLIDYALFGSTADGYHLVQILLHLVNSLLLFVIVRQLSKQWRLAFVSAILFAALTPGSWAVMWITVHDPLAVAFNLATVWFWVICLQTRRKSYYAWAFAALLASFLSKESSATLPITLFLVDRLLVEEKVRVQDLVRRYFLIGFALFVYLLLEVEVQSHGYFPNKVGYGLGWHMVENTLRYLGLLVFPWGLDQVTSYIWFFTGLALFAIAAKGSDKGLAIRVLLFLAIQAMLTIAPILGFQLSMFEPRYLYSASTVAAVFLAILFEWARKTLPDNLRYRLSICAAAILLLSLQCLSTSQFLVDMVEFSRQSRVPLRDIVQQHPTFPPDTYTYFVDGCQQRITSGMFFLRYGSGVTVMCSDVEAGGVEWGSIQENRFAGLRDHKNSVVYYYDDLNRRHEVPVDPKADSIASLVPPVDFQVPIRLEGYELTSSSLKRGSELVVLLYWKAQGSIEKDYTVFVHLVDENGRQISGRDGQPRNGFAPTNTWRKDKLVVDARIVPIPPDAPIGSKCRLEIGLYYFPTMERLAIVDATGQAMTDTFVIQPFSVVE